MKISDLLDAIEDDTVPIREKNIIASERIMEVTMEKIKNDASNNGSAREKPGKGTLVLLIAAALLALSVTAYASGIFSRLVNWQGQTMETETEPMATIPPDAVMIGDESRNALIGSILEQREDRELMIVWDDGSASSTERTAPLASVEELAELLTREDSSLTVPLTVPEGYTLITGRVSFNSARGYGYTLESTEIREDGLVVERYSAPVEGDFISGFVLEWENVAGDRISLSAQMMQDADAMGFGVWDGDRMSPLTVTGMDDALGMVRDSSATVWMRQKLATPVYCESSFALMSPADNAPDDFPDEAYQDIVYDIIAQNMKLEDLQSLLDS